METIRKGYPELLKKIHSTRLSFLREGINDSIWMPLQKNAKLPGSTCTVSRALVTKRHWLMSTECPRERVCRQKDSTTCKRSMDSRKAHTKYIWYEPLHCEI
jgi:hypothetical protein